MTRRFHEIPVRVSTPTLARLEELASDEEEQRNETEIATKAVAWAIHQSDFLDELRYS